MRHAREPKKKQNLNEFTLPTPVLMRPENGFSSSGFHCVCKGIQSSFFADVYFYGLYKIIYFVECGEIKMDASIQLAEGAEEIERRKLLREIESVKQNVVDATTKYYYAPEIQIQQQP